MPDQTPPNPEGPDLKAIAKRLGPASVLAALWAFLPGVLGIVLLTNLSRASGFLDQAKPYDAIIYVAFFVVTAGFGLLPTYAQALFGGYRFKAWVGSGLALAGFVGASIIGYYVARTIAKDRVEAEIARWPKAEVVKRALVGHGPVRTLFTVALIRLPPNSPFAITNLLLSSVGVHPVIYVLGTAIGMLPRTAAVAWLGSQIQNWDNRELPGWYLPTQIGVAVLVLLILAQIGKSALERASRSGEIAEPVATETPAQDPPAAD